MGHRAIFYRARLRRAWQGRTLRLWGANHGSQCHASAAGAAAAQGCAAGRQPWCRQDQPRRRPGTRCWYRLSLPLELFQMARAADVLSKPTSSCSCASLCREVMGSLSRYACSWLPICRAAVGSDQLERADGHDGPAGCRPAAGWRAGRHLRLVRSRS